MSEPTLAQKVVAVLCQKGLVLATAESCTGGLVAKSVTDVAGSSGCFAFGFVTYANRAKVQLLGVREQTLAAHGAVSRPTAQQMAEGALRVAGADVAVSLTGIAGPAGGSVQKPQGLVYLGLATRQGTQLQKLLFCGQPRTAVRQNACDAALQAVLAWAQSL